MKKCKFFISALLLCAAIASAPVRGEIVDGIACKVGGSIITVHEFDKAYRYEKWQAELLGKAEPEKTKVMNALVDNLLLKLEAQKRGIVVGEDELDKIVRDVREQNNLSEEEFARELEKERMTLKDLRERYRLELYKARLINQMAAERNIKISEEEIRAFYDEPGNKRLMSVPALVKLSYLLIVVPEEASYKEAVEIKNSVTSIYNRAQAGENFRDLIMAHSMDPEKAKNEGNLGSFTQDQLKVMMGPDVVDLIFSLGKGEIAPPVRYREGYYLFKIDDKREGRELSYTEAYENIKSHLLRRKGEEQFGLWLSSTKKAAKIQYMIDLE